MLPRYGYTRISRKCYSFVPHVYWLVIIAHSFPNNDIVDHSMFVLVILSSSVISKHLTYLYWVTTGRLARDSYMQWRSNVWQLNYVRLNTTCCLLIYDNYVYVYKYDNIHLKRTECSCLILDSIYNVRYMLTGVFSFLFSGKWMWNKETYLIMTCCQYRCVLASYRGNASTSLVYFVPLYTYM